MNDGTADGDGIARFYGWVRTEMFSWDVPARHTGGVTDDPVHATECVEAELADAPPDSVGDVHRVMLGNPDYVNLGRVGRARRGDDGDVVWWLNPDWPGPTGLPG
jgi:hypothetical protein